MGSLASNTFAVVEAYSRGNPVHFWVPQEPEALFALFILRAKSLSLPESLNLVSQLSQLILIVISVTNDLMFQVNSDTIRYQFTEDLLLCENCDK